MDYATSRLKTVKASASAAISVKAKAMAAAGQDVIDLGLGEPDFDTPAHIIEAAHQAALRGETRYPNTQGTAALRAAVVDKFRRDNGLTFAADQVIVSNGAKQVIFDAMMATLEPGSEVILCAPYFDSYRNIVSVIGGVPVTVTCRVEEGFLLQSADLESAITSKTRWVLLNSPSNPSGAVYRSQDFAALGEALRRHPHVLILSDEIYEGIVFDGAPFASFAAVCPDLTDRVLTVNGVSKAYAMTGWRIGYGAGPKGLIAAMTTVQSQISSGACSIAQAAALAALTGPQDCIETFRTAYQRRRDLVMGHIAQIPGLTLRNPGGAFYALIDCSALLGGDIPDDVAFTAWLLKAAGLATVPGSVYETPGYFRISTATDDATLTRAMGRLAKAVATLSKDIP